MLLAEVPDPDFSVAAYSYEKVGLGLLVFKRDEIEVDYFLIILTDVRTLLTGLSVFD